MKRFLPIALLSLVIGCASLTPVNTADLQQAKEQAEVTRKATTQAISDAQKEIGTLPANDPVRKALEDKVAKLNDVVNKADIYITKANTVLEGIQTGNYNPLQDAVKGIPYGGLVLALGGLAYNWYRLVNTKTDLKEHQTALEQVVKSVDVAMPDKTAEQKLVMASVQDSKTQELVKEAKKGV